MRISHSQEITHIQVTMESQLKSHYEREIEEISVRYECEKKELKNELSTINITLREYQNTIKS